MCNFVNLSNFSTSGSMYAINIKKKYNMHMLKSTFHNQSFIRFTELFVRALETGRKASFSGLHVYLFHNKCKFILYLLTMYIYFAYPAM